MNSVAVKLIKQRLSKYGISWATSYYRQWLFIDAAGLAKYGSRSGDVCTKKDGKLLYQSPPQTAQRAAGGYAVNATIPIPSAAKPGTMS